MAIDVSRLWGAVRDGVLLDLWPGRPLSLEEVQVLGEDHAIEAAELRLLLVTQKVPPPPPPAGREEVTPSSGAAEAVKPDPRGIQIRGAWIRGPLELDDLDGDTKIGLRLTACRFDATVTLRAATLPWLDLDGCVLPAVVADYAQLGDLSIGGCRLTGSGTRERIRLPGAHVTNDLKLTATIIDGPFGPGPRPDRPGEWAVQAGGVNIGGRLSLEDAIIRHHVQPAAAGGGTPGGAVCLTGAVVGADLVVRRATLTSDHGPALMADNLTVKGNALLDEGFVANGAVRWWGAAITGQLSLTGARITTTAAGSAQDPTRAAAVCLSGANVGGRLMLRRATLKSTHGSALMADYLTVKGDAFCCETHEDGMTATGAGPRGALLLSGASITGRLALRASLLDGGGGPALNADLVTVQQGVFLDEGFTATGAVRLWGASVSGQLSLAAAVISTTAARDDQDPTAAAAVCLSGATIGGRLVLRRASLCSRHGSALMADYLTVKGDTFLCESEEEGFTARGAGGLGVVCLAAATIAGQLSLRGTTLTNTGGPRDDDRGPALLAESAAVAGDVMLDGAFTARAEGWPGAAVCLTDATVGKQLACAIDTAPLPRAPGDPAVSRAWTLARAKVGTFDLVIAPPSGRGGRQRSPLQADPVLDLEGFTYTGLPRLRPTPASPATPAAAAWIEVLQRRACYAAQPYEVLAAAYEAIGDDPSARNVLIAQRDDTRRRGRLGRWSRTYQWFLKGLIGYGYKSIRAIAWLALLFVVTIGCSLAFGHNRWIVGNTPAASTAAASTTATTAASGPVAAPASCTPTGDVAYAITLAFPIINLSGSTGQQCDVPATDPRWWIIAFGWVVRALAATLARFYAAGLAGITRSPSSS